MPPPKGKQGTKGQKQIVDENRDTIRFYAYLASGAMGIHLTIQYIFFWDTFTTGLWAALILAGIIYAASTQFMVYMARAFYSESGQLTDGGVDLNMEAGVAEHVKDLIILTASCQMLTLISNYFWLLWFLAPARAGFILWKNIIAPWVFQPAPEVSEKKQKKMERKLAKRH